MDEQLLGKIKNLHSAHEFYLKAVADPQGLEVGAVADGIDWILTAAQAVTDHALFTKD